MFSRVGIIDADAPELDEVLKDFDVEHGMVKLQCSHYFQQEFERGYVFTAKARTQTAKAPLLYTP